MGNNKEKIIEIISSQEEFIKKRYHVKSIGVFGSFARGEETKDSDVDILVEFDVPVGFFEFIRLENFLSKILERKVDLVTKKAVKPSIKEEVFKEAIYV